jgi:hypothetical protein
VRRVTPFSGRKGILEDHSLLSKFIYVGAGFTPVTITGEMVWSHCIHHDQDDVGHVLGHLL